MNWFAGKLKTSVQIYWILKLSKCEECEDKKFESGFCSSRGQTEMASDSGRIY